MPNFTSPLDRWRTDSMPWSQLVFHRRASVRCRKQPFRQLPGGRFITELRKSTQKRSLPENPQEYRRFRDTLHDDAAKHGSTV